MALLARASTDILEDLCMHLLMHQVSLSNIRYIKSQAASLLRTSSQASTNSSNMLCCIQNCDH